MPRVQIHRFRDNAALSVTANPDGGTVYLTAANARALARALTAAARSIESESFIDSPNLSAEIYASTFAVANVPNRDPAPRKHVVTVESYSLAPGQVGAPYGLLYRSEHRSARAAARRLAELINGKTERAREVQRKIGPGHGENPRAGRYTVDGMALVPFRRKYGLA